jgi:hypothetical protein
MLARKDDKIKQVRLSDIEARFVCQACGKRSADVRPDFNWKKRPVGAMGLSPKELTLVAHIGVAAGFLAEVGGLNGRMA